MTQLTNESSARPSAWPKYTVGAVLAYGVCVILGAKTFSSELSEGLQIGVVMGLFLFFIVGPAHFLLQLFAHGILKGFGNPEKQTAALLLNLPALLALVGLSISAVVPPRASTLRQALKEHLGGPLPDSVQIKGYRMRRGLNEGSYVFVFSVRPDDLGSLLRHTDLVPDSSGTEATGLQWCQEKAQELTRGAAKIDAPCTVYFSKTNQGISRTTKTLVVGSNGVDVVFCENFF